MLTLNLRVKKGGCKGRLHGRREGEKEKERKRVVCSEAIKSLPPKRRLVHKRETRPLRETP
jgi:hypothetical protein